MEEARQAVAVDLRDRGGMLAGMYLGDQKALDVRGRAVDPSANEMFGGPTAIDFSMLPTRLLVPRSEKKSLAAWREQDLAQYYREQNRRDFAAAR